MTIPSPTDEIIPETDCPMCGERVDDFEPRVKFAIRMRHFRMRIGVMHARCAPEDMETWMKLQSDDPPPTRMDFERALLRTESGERLWVVRGTIR